MIVQAFLRRLQRSSLFGACLLRGSQLTARWVPGRVAQDLDFLLDGEWTVESASASARQLLELDDAIPLEGRLEPIWTETPWPGLRLCLTSGAQKLQVDLGWAEPLALPPVPFELHGITFRSSPPEMMLAWKIHSLVERGPRGRWHAKTLADLALFARHLKLVPERVRPCIELAFEVRRMSLSALDGFFEDPTWGMSRGSRNKWKSYRKKSPWVDFTLEEALTSSRALTRRMLAR